MFRPFLKSSIVASAVCCIAAASAAPVSAQQIIIGGRGGGGSIQIGRGGVGLGIGTGRPYRNYDYVRPGYPRGVYIDPIYIAPAPREVYRPSSVIYQTPTVQPGPVIVDSSRIPVPAEPVGQRTNLPGVSFGAREHLGVLSDAVAERTTKLCELLKASYQGNPQFQEVYQDTELLAAGARQIPALAADPEKMLTAIQDLNTLFEALSPAIESWQSSGASASGPLSSVKSALQLLSTDAGYDPNQSDRRPVTIPTQRVAPRTAEPEPTPVDAVPTPADAVPVPSDTVPVP